MTQSSPPADSVAHWVWRAGVGHLRYVIVAGLLGAIAGFIYSQVQPPRVTRAFFARVPGLKEPAQFEALTERLNGLGFAVAVSARITPPIDALLVRRAFEVRPEGDTLRVDVSDVRAEEVQRLSTAIRAALADELQVPAWGTSVERTRDYLAELRRRQASLTPASGASAEGRQTGPAAAPREHAETERAWLALGREIRRVEEQLLEVSDLVFRDGELRVPNPRARSIILTVMGGVLGLLLGGAFALASAWVRSPLRLSIRY